MRDDDRPRTLLGRLAQGRPQLGPDDETRGRADESAAFGPDDVSKARDDEVMVLDSLTAARTDE